MPNLLPVTLLIPTMNRPNTLNKTLNSIKGSSILPAQIVIVDQSTDDDTREQNRAALNAMPDGIEKTFIVQDRASLTLARNKALQAAKQEVLVFADDDIELYRETLSNINKIMTNPNIAMIAGIDDNSAPSSTDIGYLLGTKSYFKRKIGHVTASMLGRYPDNISDITATQWAMGYFFVVRKSLCSKYDVKWDEQLESYAYAEDLDFSFSYYKKASQDNLDCILTPEVRVKHMVSNEYRIPSYKSSWMYIVHRRYLSYKHGLSWTSRLAMNWCDFWRLVERVLKRQKPGDIMKAYLYYLKHKAAIKRGCLK